MSVCLLQHYNLIFDDHEYQNVKIYRQIFRNIGKINIYIYIISWIMYIQYIIIKLVWYNIRNIYLICYILCIRYMGYLYYYVFDTWGIYIMYSIPGIFILLCIQYMGYLYYYIHIHVWLLIELLIIYILAFWKLRYYHRFRPMTQIYRYYRYIILFHIIKYILLKIIIIESVTHWFTILLPYN